MAHVIGEAEDGGEVVVHLDDIRQWIATGARLQEGPQQDRPAGSDAAVVAQAAPQQQEVDRGGTQLAAHVQVGLRARHVEAPLGSDGS
eukprot:16376292-Heterocapsa_arctica.AAC.1